MINFFDKYRDLFDVDNQTLIPSTRLTPQHPLFSSQSSTLPLKDLKFNSRPIDVTKELDSFESKLQNWKKQRQYKPLRLSSPLKLEDINYNRRPSSRKRSIVKSNLKSQLEKLDELEDMLFVDSSSIQGSQSPVIKKIISYEYQTSSNSNQNQNQKHSQGKWEVNKNTLLKRRLSTKSEIPVSSHKKQQSQIKEEKTKWTIEEMKLHKPAISTNAFVQHRRSEAQRNMRARQNKLRALLSGKY